MTLEGAVNDENIKIHLLGRLRGCPYDRVEQEGDSCLVKERIPGESFKEKYDFLFHEMKINECYQIFNSCIYCSGILNPE